MKFHQNRWNFTKIDEISPKSMKIHQIWWNIIKIDEISSFLMHISSQSRDFIACDEVSIDFDGVFIKIDAISSKLVKFHQNWWKFIKIGEDSSKSTKFHQYCCIFHHNRWNFIDIDAYSSQSMEFHRFWGCFHGKLWLGGVGELLHQAAGSYVRIQHSAVIGRISWFWSSFFPVWLILMRWTHLCGQKMVSCRVYCRFTGAVDVQHLDFWIFAPIF